MENQKNALLTYEILFVAHHYEDDAVKYFEATAKCTVEKCGFFHHLQKKRYGSSSDGLGPLGILLEVKTKDEASRGPLTSINKFPQYFVQCQLQMLCTNAEFCILQSYHPETTSSNFFLGQTEQYVNGYIH